MIKKKKRRKNPYTGHDFQWEIVKALQYANPVYLSQGLLYYKIGPICQDCNNKYQFCHCDDCEECGLIYCICKFNINDKDEDQIRRKIWKIVRSLVNNEILFMILKEFATTINPINLEVYKSKFLNNFYDIADYCVSRLNWDTDPNKLEKFLKQIDEL